MQPHACSSAIFASYTSRYVSCREREEDLTFLQHLIEVDGIFGVGGKGMCPSEIILLDGLGLGALSIVFHAVPPKGALGSHHPIFPRNDGAFPFV
jgi:hypothetical protein